MRIASQPAGIQEFLVQWASAGHNGTAGGRPSADAAVLNGKGEGDGEIPLSRELVCVLTSDEGGASRGAMGGGRAF